MDMAYSSDAQISLVVASQHIASCTTSEGDISWSDEEAKERQAAARRLFHPAAKVIRRALRSLGLANPRVHLDDILKHQTDVYLAIVVTIDSGKESVCQVTENVEELFRQTEEVLSSLSTYSKPAEVAIVPGATVSHAGDRLMIAPKYVADMANGVREAAASAKGKCIDAEIHLPSGATVHFSCKDPAICYTGDEVLRSDAVTVDGLRDSDQRAFLIFDRPPENAKSSVMSFFFDDCSVRAALCEAYKKSAPVAIRWVPHVEQTNGTVNIAAGEVVAVESADQRVLDIGE